jgi:hypothetical protein
MRGLASDPQKEESNQGQEYTWYDKEERQREHKTAWRPTQDAEKKEKPGNRHGYPTEYIHDTMHSSALLGYPRLELIDRTKFGDAALILLPYSVDFYRDFN